MDQTQGYQHRLTTDGRLVIIPFGQTLDRPLRIYDSDNNEITSDDLTSEEKKEIYNIVQYREEYLLLSQMSAPSIPLPPHEGSWTSLANPYNDDYNILRLSSNRVVGVSVNQTTSERLRVIDANGNIITNLTVDEENDINSYLRYADSNDRYLN